MKKHKISYETYGKIIKQLTENIKIIPRNITAVYGVPRGGLIPAIHIAHNLNIPIIYNLCDFKDNKKEYLLVVDDIVDTGATFEKIEKQFKFIGYKKPVFVSIHLKPKSSFIPDLFYSRTDDWIVYSWETIDSEISEYHKSIYPELDESNDIVLHLNKSYRDYYAS